MQKIFKRLCLFTFKPKNNSHYFCWVSLCLSLLLFSPVETRAESNLCGLQKLFSAPEKPNLDDTSVELEINFVQPLHALLTTANGKVGGLLKATETLSEYDVEWLNTLFPGEDPLEIPWDRFTDDQKDDLINDVSQLRKQDFFRDRIFHGLVPRKITTLTFEKPTEFLGVRYSAHEPHPIDLSQVLGKVEYSNPTAVKSGKGVELHFRSHFSAGTVSESAREFLEGMRIPPTHQHVHIVSRVPEHLLIKSDHLKQAEASIFYLNANLAAEFTHVIEEGGGIHTESYDSVTHFDSLSPDHLGNVVKYIHGMSDGNSRSFINESQMAYINLRSSNTYDQPGRWGLEFRSIPHNANRKTYRKLLDSVQRSFQSETFGLPEATIQHWINNKKDLQKLITDALYNQEWENLAVSSPGLKQSLIAASKTQRELKMLVFDWSKHPLVAADPKLEAQILKNQQLALKRFSSGESINAIMKDFLLDSGLHRAVMKSLGMP